MVCLKSAENSNNYRRIAILLGALLVGVTASACSDDDDSSDEAADDDSDGDDADDDSDGDDADDDDTDDSDDDDSDDDDSDDDDSDEDDTDDADDADDDADAGASTTELNLRVDRLEPLGGDFEYEGWVIVEGEPVSTGRFNLEEGQTEVTFEVPEEYADSAEAFVLSIEPPAAEDDPAPADTKVLGGAFDSGSASLSLDFEAALNTDFAEALGHYFLATPTSADVVEDYDQGIWFIDNSSGSPEPGLSLPELPAGWEYEGWVVGDDGPVSTGRFTAVDAADSDGPGETAGPDGAPPFPGQDFIDPAVSLIDYKVVISVEPVPDDSEAPFALKPLYGQAAASGNMVVQYLPNQTAMNNPTGVATFGELPEADKTVTVELEQLSTLGSGYAYEGWVIVEDAPVSTGRFNVIGDRTSFSFPLAADYAENATAFVLSIEPPLASDDPEPAPTKVLGGELTDGVAELGIDFAAALGTDFADATGRFFLETPTTATVADDYDLGIWFIDNSSGSPAAGLSLPTLPEGWAYEGWVVGDDGPVSTGRFTAVDAADSDGPGATAGPDAAPPFPGQDFIDPAVSLIDYGVVISVEPMPDDSAAPFDLKPLVGTAENVGAAAVVQDLTNQSDTNNAAGTATIE